MLVNIQNQYIKRVIPIFDITTIASTNQPSTASAGKRINVVSNNAGDTQSIIIWGYKTGDLVTPVYEKITVNGTTPVNSVATNWETIIGAFLGDEFGNITARATGIILVRNQDNNTIYTIAATKLSIGSVYFQIDGENTQLYNETGNIYYNTITIFDTNVVPVASITSGSSWKLDYGASDVIKVKSYISMVSDVSGATCQIRIFDY
jgi:hypothetical protein